MDGEGETKSAEGGKDLEAPPGGGGENTSAHQQEGDENDDGNGNSIKDEGTEGQGRVISADSQFRFETSPVDAILKLLFILNLAAMSCLGAVEPLTASHRLYEHSPRFYWLQY